MVKAVEGVIVLLGVWAVAQALSSTPGAEAQLNPYFYDESCPFLFPIVGKTVWSAILDETRIAASLLRVHFHDCFVQGCDGSDLLDPLAGDTNGSTSEKFTAPNRNSLRGFEVIDTIKANVESSCPNVVSCADIVTLAAFFSVVLSGGPVWLVSLGKRDALTANPALSLTNLPAPFFNYTQLNQSFTNQNLTLTDLVALSGGHTIGQFRCASVYKRLYDFDGNFSNAGPGVIGDTDPTINSTLLTFLLQLCPYNVSNGNQPAGNVTNPMDVTTPALFDNSYYIQLLSANGRFTSDQQLFVGDNDTQALVELYASDQDQFFSDFASGMTSMGNLLPLTGTEGEIRQNCRVANPVSSIIEEEKRSEKRVEQFEGGLEVFEKTIKKLVDQIYRGEELGRLVEDSVSSGFHSYI